MNRRIMGKIFFVFISGGLATPFPKPYRAKSPHAGNVITPRVLTCILTHRYYTCTHRKLKIEIMNLLSV